ncbi:MAG: DnaD domain protein [Chloroflexi bacterium]|nr:DnaD domain protein [Chloroflexota bacterium]
MAKYPGFVRGTRYTCLPNDVFGTLLQDIETLAELKCTLRVLALLHQRRGQSPGLSLDELLADRVLRQGLGDQPGGPLAAIRQGVAAAVERGTLLEHRSGEGEGGLLLLVNDEQGRRARNQMPESARRAASGETVAPQQGAEVEGARDNIFALYEENIGLLTPLLAEELKEAASAYPWPWIQEAFREAVVHNRRSWRYVARVLERWTTEGKGHGKPGRHPEAADPKEYLRRYGRSL